MIQAEYDYNDTKNEPALFLKRYMADSLRPVCFSEGAL